MGVCIVSNLSNVFISLIDMRLYYDYGCKIYQIIQKVPKLYKWSRKIFLYIFVTILPRTIQET